MGMGIEKAEIKKLLLDELGNEFDDMLEAAEHEVFRHQGGAKALKGAQAAVMTLMGHIAKDVKEQKISVEAGDYAQSYIRKAAGLLDNLSTSAEIHAQRATGARDNLAKIVKKTKARSDAEAAKMEAPERPDSEARAPGEHPGPSAADQRRAEDQAASGGSEAEGQPEDSE